LSSRDCLVESVLVRVEPIFSIWPPYRTIRRSNFVLFAAWPNRAMLFVHIHR
jgi:hypothetical protein